MGFEKHSNTNLIDSPEARFRRQQIKKYMETGQSLAEASEYGRQIGTR